MSRVILLCADHPLPLYAAQTRRVYFHRGVRYEEEGFSVQPHVYYRPAVDNLELSMKPHRYELDLRATEQDAALLRDYLRQSCIPGEQVELWNLWVGVDREDQVSRFQGELADLALDTLEQLCFPPVERDCPGQCRLTVTI